MLPNLSHLIFDELRRGKDTSGHTIQQIPIVNTVINLVVVFYDLGEQLSQEIIVRGFFKTKLADIV